MIFFRALLLAWHMWVHRAATECPATSQLWLSSSRKALSKTEELASSLQVSQGGSIQSLHTCTSLVPLPLSPIKIRLISPGAPPCFRLIMHKFLTFQITHCHNIINMQISLKEPIRNNAIDGSLGCGVLI